MIDDEVVSNRSELIKRARDSCARGFDGPNTYPANSKAFRSTRNYNTKQGNEIYKIKFFVIRIVIAIVILLSIIFIDKMKITYDNFNSAQISNMLHSNHLYEQAKKYVDIVFKADKKEENAKNAETTPSEVENVEVENEKVKNAEVENEKTSEDETQAVINTDE